jgi:hypothetical protein
MKPSQPPSPTLKTVTSHPQTASIQHAEPTDLNDPHLPTTPAEPTAATAEHSSHGSAAPSRITAADPQHPYPCRYPWSRKSGSNRRAAAYKTVIPWTTGPLPATTVISTIAPADSDHPGALGFAAHPVARRASPSPVTPGDPHAARPACTRCARPASRRTRHVPGVGVSRHADRPAERCQMTHGRS